MMEPAVTLEYAALYIGNALSASLLFLVAGDEWMADVAVPPAWDDASAPITLEARYVRTVGEAVLAYHDFPLWIMVVITALGTKAHLHL
jgi:hypothetical protein